MGVAERVLIAACLAILLSLTWQPQSAIIAPRVAAHAPRQRVARVIRYRHAPARVHRLAPAPPRLTAANTVLGFPPPPVLARAAYLIDMQSGRRLFAKNPDLRLPMASTTKITTAAVVLDDAGLSDLAWVSKRAATIGESTMVLQRGERLTVKQLLYGLMLNSANDAAITLAEHVSGNQERFVKLMNALARRLGMRNTHYVTAHGLDAPHHYTSARDLSTVTMYAMRNPTFRKIVATMSYHIKATKHNQEHWLASINRVMYWYPGVDGVKPGDTDNAGLCQVVSAWRGGRHLLAVLLNTPNLVTDIRNLLDYGAKDFRWVQADAYWDSPANSIGGPSRDPWSYVLGAGHFVRGPFLAYFNSHGGVRALGYPRTEEIREGDQTVQYFQSAKLVYDSYHHSVYPEAVGATLAQQYAASDLRTHTKTAHVFAGFYKMIGGRGVLGAPVTGDTWIHGVRSQFFQYGELVRENGATYLAPVGDAELHLKGWLPATGVADAFPPTVAPRALDFVAPPQPPLTLIPPPVVRRDARVIRARFTTAGLERPAHRLNTVRSE